MITKFRLIELVLASAQRYLVYKDDPRGGATKASSGNGYNVDGKTNYTFYIALCTTIVESSAAVPMRWRKVEGPSACGVMRRQPYHPHYPTKSHHDYIRFVEPTIGFAVVSGELEHDLLTTEEEAIDYLKSLRDKENVSVYRRLKELSLPKTSTSILGSLFCKKEKNALHHLVEELQAAFTHEKTPLLRKTSS